MSRRHAGPPIIPVFIVVGIAVLSVIGWLTMLCLGVAHSYDSRVPDLGFFASLWLSYALRIALVGVSVSRSDRSRS